MKKLIVLSAVVLGLYSTATAQKVGHINTEEVLSLMPEAAKVEAEMKQFQADLGQAGQDLQVDAQKKQEDFIKDSVTMTPSMKEIKRGELIKLYTRLQNYEQEAQEKYQQYSQTKIAPLQQKLLEAIKTVAKEKGYGYVINEASNALLVSPESDDLLPAVKVKLGIKDSAAAPKTAAQKPAGK